MKDRNWYWRLTGLAAPCALLATLALGPAGSSAGIFRDMLAKIGVAKTGPAPPGPSSTHELPWEGYTCCNLHYDGDEIIDSNYAELPMIAAGTPITVLGYGKDRATVKIEGRLMRLEHEYGRKEENLQAWLSKIVVDQDPRPRIRGYPEPVRAAISEGKVMVGMTRDQALVAVGYPLTNENISVEAPAWRMWRSRRGEYQLKFHDDGRVATVSGDDEVTAQMLYTVPRK